MTKRPTIDRVDATRDEDIDFSDIPEIPPEMFARAVVHKGLKPVSEAQGFMRLAGAVSGPKDLSRRKGFPHS